MGTLRLLVIEDSAADAALVQALLDEAAPGACRSRHVDRLSDAVAQLPGLGVDCVLLDLSLPDADGLDALAQVRAAAREVPVIVLSGRTDERLAIRAVQEGAQDYLLKGEVDGRLLWRSIAYAIERKRAEVELAHRALHDHLTGLPNRALLFDRLGQALTRLGRHDESSLAVLFCDLDRFKVVNDSLGHVAGDALLRAVADRLDGVLRAGDTAARFGGDEFVVLCEDVRGAEHAVGIAERIRNALAAPMQLKGEGEIYVHASIGIAITDAPSARPEMLVRDADAAMQRAKERGGASYEVFDAAMRARAVRRLETENALHRALKRDEFRLHYQPQVALESGRVTGAEALIRWERPGSGLLAPGHFIGAAEDTGLIGPIGAWVLEEACREAAGWGPSKRVMSVNLSARQVIAPDLVQTVAAILHRTGCDPASLCLELTESAVLDDMELTARQLHGLKDLGLTLAIDDFGTGYSSLAALQRLPFDVVKIDRSFVAQMSSEQGSAIVAAVVFLSHTLELETVAEGIETEGQLERLRALGCDTGQGFWFWRPMPPADLRNVLA